MNDQQRQNPEVSEQPNESGAPQKKAATWSKVPSRYPLPSDRHSFAVHWEVLKRFQTLSRNGAEPIEAYKVEGDPVPAQGAEMNVRFLKSIGLLSSPDRGKYLPTEKTAKLLSHKSVSDDRARPILYDILKETWFAQTALAVVQHAGGALSENQLVAELALSAETNREKKGPALEILVDYLVFSGILVRSEKGDLSVGTAAGGPPPVLREARPAAPSGGMARLPPAAFQGQSDGEEWHIVQTEDFSLRIKSDPDAIEDLKLHLDALRRKVDRKSGSSTSGGGPLVVVKPLGASPGICNGCGGQIGPDQRFVKFRGLIGRSAYLNGRRFHEDEGEVVHKLEQEALTRSGTPDQAEIENVVIPRVHAWFAESRDSAA